MDEKLCTWEDYMYLLFTAVVGALGLREAADGPAERRRLVEVEERIFLLEAEPRRVGRVAEGGRAGEGARGRASRGGGGERGGGERGGGVRACS